MAALPAEVSARRRIGGTTPTLYYAGGIRMDLSAFISFQGAISFAKAVMEARDYHKVAEVEQRLTRVLVDVQAAYLELYERAAASNDSAYALKGRVRELEEKLGELELRTADRGRYEIAALSEGVYVLSLKHDSAGAEPHHYLCQPCMDNRGKKATLQRIVEGFMIKLACPECGYKYPTGKGISSTKAPADKSPPSTGPHGWMAR